MNYEFCSGKDLCAISRREGIPVSEIMIRSEMERSGRSRKSVVEEMNGNLGVMRESIRNGLEAGKSHHGIFTGNGGRKIMAFAGQSNMGESMAKVVAAAMAVVEWNASMGKIVAAPTAGASGILPAVLIVCGEKRGFDDSQICRGLFAAGAIGCVIAKNGYAGAMERVGNQMHTDLKETARGGLAATPTALKLMENMG